MLNENEKYKKILIILRKSKPVLDSTIDIEREVIKRIKEEHKSRNVLSEIAGFIFGWIYIEWVRKSLITASVMLVLVFVYQQSIIIKKIDILSRQVVMTDENIPSAKTDFLERSLLMYKFSGRIIPSKDVVISEKQMEQLMGSFNKLQGKYDDLLDLIREDPDLKQYIEKKLTEKNAAKINL